MKRKNENDIRAAFVFDENDISVSHAPQAYITALGRYHQRFFMRKNRITVRKMMQIALRQSVMLFALLIVMLRLAAEVM